MSLSPLTLRDLKYTLLCNNQVKTQVANILASRYTTVSMDQELSNLMQLTSWVQAANCGPDAIGNPTEEVIIIPTYILSNISAFCMGFANQSLSLFKSHKKAIEHIESGHLTNAFKQLQKIENSAKLLAERCEGLINQTDFLCGVAEQAYGAAIRKGLPLYAEKHELLEPHSYFLDPCENVVRVNELNAQINDVQEIITARGKILTIFQNSRLFWSEVRDHLIDATNVSGPRLYLGWRLPGESEMELEKIYINMLTLDKITLTIGSILGQNYS